MKALTILLGLALFFGKACGDTVTDPPDDSINKEIAFELARTFELSMDQVARNTESGLTIKFLGVTEDSRCPRNTNCVWAGQAKTSFVVNGESVELILQEDKPSLAKHRLSDGEHVILAEALSPYPEGTRINEKDYRVQLFVTKMLP